MKKFKYLDSYVKLYESGSELGGRYLPKLIIYFREVFDKIGLTDDGVPEFFGWDENTAEDFWSWGHNSRWSHTFDAFLADNLEHYVALLKDTMEQEGIEDFEIKLDKGE